MRLFILGVNTDDKGTQLEKLTKSIYESFGYTNLSLSKHGAYGEIDVSGEASIAAVMNPTIFHVIGECKARSDPINMTDWMKFYGKLATHRILVHQNTVGHMVALTGANGQVSASYESIKKHDPNVRLVTADYLVEHLQQTHNLLSLNNLRDKVRQLSDRSWTDISLAYYDSKVYWIIEYGEGNYTILTATGVDIESETLSKLEPMLAQQIAASKHISLAVEALATERAHISLKAVMGAAVAGNGVTTKSVAQTLFKQIDLTVEDIEQSTKALVDLGFISVEGENIQLTERLDIDIKFLVEFLKLFIHGIIVSIAVGSKWMDRHINEALVEEACNIQMGVKLTLEQKANAVKLMKWSHLGLINVLIPHPIIVNHRGALGYIDPSVLEYLKLNEQDAKSFMLILHQGLAADFAKPELAKCYYEVFRIDCLDIIHSVKVVNRDMQVLHTDKLSMGYRICEMDESAPPGTPKYVLTQTISRTDNDAIASD